MKALEEEGVINTYYEDVIMGELSDKDLICQAEAVRTEEKKKGRGAKRVLYTLKRASFQRVKRLAKNFQGKPIYKR